MKIKKKVFAIKSKIFLSSKVNFDKSSLNINRYKTLSR